MKIALHIPCYINELFPEVAKSTILLLRELKFNVTNVLRSAFYK